MCTLNRVLFLGDKMARQYIVLECFWCKQEFNRIKSEHTRNEKKNRKTFCNATCQTRYYNSIRDKNQCRKNFAPIKNWIAKNGYPIKKDEYSDFRRLLSITKNRATKGKKDFNLTLEYLKQVWENQKSICPYTGWKLSLDRDSEKISTWNRYKASIDRIDSSKGYVEGNIQYVCFMANIAKNTFTEEELLIFCKAVSENRK